MGCTDLVDTRGFGNRKGQMFRSQGAGVIKIATAMSANTTGGDMSEQQPQVTAQDAAGMARTALTNTGELHRVIAGDHRPAEVDELLEQAGYDSLIDAIVDLAMMVDGKTDPSMQKQHRIKQLRDYLERKASNGKAMATYDEIVAHLQVSEKTAYRYMECLAEQPEFTVDESTGQRRLLADFGGYN